MGFSVNYERSTTWDLPPQSTLGGPLGSGCRLHPGQDCPEYPSNEFRPDQSSNGGAESPQAASTPPARFLQSPAGRSVAPRTRSMRPRIASKVLLPAPDYGQYDLPGGP